MLEGAPVIHLLTAITRLLHPLRLIGAFGTSSAPRIFKAGEDVPAWVFMRWPMKSPKGEPVNMRFGVDVETFAVGITQHVHPLMRMRDDECIVKIDGWTDRIETLTLIGNGTHVHSEPRFGGGGGRRVHEGESLQMGEWGIIG